MCYEQLLQSLLCDLNNVSDYSDITTGTLTYEDSTDEKSENLLLADDHVVLHAALLDGGDGTAGDEKGDCQSP